MKTFEEVKEYILSICKLITVEHLDKFEKFLDEATHEKYKFVPEGVNVKELFIEAMNGEHRGGFAVEADTDHELLVIQSIEWLPEHFYLWDSLDNEWKYLTGFYVRPVHGTEY